MFLVFCRCPLWCTLAVTDCWRQCYFDFVCMCRCRCLAPAHIADRCSVRWSGARRSSRWIFRLLQRGAWNICEFQCLWRGLGWLYSSRANHTNVHSRSTAIHGVNTRTSTSSLTLMLTKSALKSVFMKLHMHWVVTIALPRAPFVGSRNTWMSVNPHPRCVFVGRMMDLYCDASTSALSAAVMLFSLWNVVALLW